MPLCSKAIVPIGFDPCRIIGANYMNMICRIILASFN
jgi:hypothetical protein